MKVTFFYFLASFLFGAGLELAQMTNPEKVQNFLNVTRQWDPSLIFVMVGAITINSLAYFLWIKSKETPLLVEKFMIPLKKEITGPLILGSALFGIGWGLAGFCPGPAISGLYRGQLDSFIIVASMITGMLFYSYGVEPFLKKTKS